MTAALCIINTAEK